MPHVFRLVNHYWLHAELGKSRQSYMRIVKMSALLTMLMQAYQMILFDTPGIIEKKRNKLEERMMAAVVRFAGKCS
jgi:GTPase Era involved in 16S rRNA processing